MDYIISGDVTYCCFWFFTLNSSCIFPLVGQYSHGFLLRFVLLTKADEGGEG